MRTVRLGALGMLITAMGCGATPACEALVQGTHDETARGTPCGYGVRPIEPWECPDWLRGCTPSDQAKIQAYGICLSQLPSCSPETRETWLLADSGCVEQLYHLTPSCPS